MKHLLRVAAIGVGLAAWGAGPTHASEEEQALVEVLPEAFHTLAGRVVLREAAAAAGAEARLDVAVAALDDLRGGVADSEFRSECGKRESDVGRLRAVLGGIAKRLQGDSAIEADLRMFLTRPDTAEVLFDAWIRGHRKVDPARLLVDHTRLGRALIRNDDGSWLVNRHAVWDLDDLLQALAKLAEQREKLLRAMDDATEPVIAAELARRALETTRDVEIAPWAALLARHFERKDGRLILREGHQETIDALALRVPLVRAELDAKGARSILDLAKLDYVREGVELLRSSIFYNPRTRAGARSYMTEFEDHYAARLFGTWGWNAKVSKNADDLVARLRRRKAGLEQLAKTHEKLIIHISGVPPWLSSSTDEGVFEGGGWENRQAHPPKDMAVWKRLIRELAKVFGSIEGVERYYEFWNEPDLEYWQGSLEDFLMLYAETARTIREVDPDGKIGGCATNQWDGRIGKRTGSDILNLELIRYAKKEDLPLDFVSWHHFGRPAPAIRKAKAAYLAEWRKVGFQGEPEWLVTEWSAPMRGTPYANARFAQLMLGFFEAGVDVQCASCWEEFHAKPDPKHFAPWGLMTQQGHRKNTWYVHRFFDRLARDSLGLAVVREDQGRTIIVSKKAEDAYDMLIWDRGTTSRLQAAWNVLKTKGFGREQAAKVYRVGDRLERAIGAGEPPSPVWAEAFAAAKKVYHEHPVQTPRLVLELANVKSIEVLKAEAVRMGHAARPVTVLGNKIACILDPQEVLRLVLRVR